MTHFLLPWARRLLVTGVLSAALMGASAPAYAQGWSFDGPELARFAADYETLRDSGEATSDASLAARFVFRTS